MGPTRQGQILSGQDQIDNDLRDLDIVSRDGGQWAISFTSNGINGSISVYRLQDGARVSWMLSILSEQHPRSPIWTWVWSPISGKNTWSLGAPPTVNCSVTPLETPALSEMAFSLIRGFGLSR